MRHSNRVGLHAVRSETVPTSPDKSGSKPRGESVYLFLEFTINPNFVVSFWGLTAYPPEQLQKQEQTMQD